MKTIKIYDKLYKHITDKVFVKSDKSEVYENVFYSPMATPDIVEVSEEEAKEIKTKNEKHNIE